ncbi:beta strand repeat-containing protein [Methylocystis sp.]|uniref:beta strand repeat-containing protein n=1 Tax=Methylocystis sp. TaxID=1911079 RepID=UPI003DA37C66
MHAVAAFFTSIITFVSGLFAPPLASNFPPDIRATQPAAAAAAPTEVVGDPFNDPVADLAVVSTSAMPTALAFSPPPAQTIINQPVVERIIERIVPQDGAISAQTLTAILTDFGQSIENRLAALNPPEADIPQQVAAAGNSSSYYFAPASQRIDQLSNTTINNPTISGGSISGTSITGTITNAIDTALATIGDLTSNSVTATNAVYTNATTTNLSVTNLAATATSTLSGLKLAATDCSVLGNGGKLTTDAFGNVTCAADQSGAGGSVGGLNTQVQFNDGGVFGGNAGFTYDKTAQRVAVTYASTTGVTASYASSTQGFFGTLSAGSLSLTTPLSASNGGTGIGNPASAGILVGSYGGGSWQQLATSSLGLLTSDIAEGSNLYFTNTRFDARLAATTTLPMLTTLANLASIGTITNGIWNGTTIGTPYGGTGSTTLSGILKGNGASAVQTALPGTDYELPLSFNAPLSRLGNTVSLSTAGDWNGTLGGFSAAQLIAAGFSTTSADAWKSARSFFATSSSDYWLSTKTTDNLAQGSSNKYYATSLFAADLAATTTSALAEGSNLYFTNNRVAGVIAGTTTDALTEGSTRLYFTNARADARINATSTIGTLTSAPNLATISTSLTGFLKATAGALSTAAINLASDITGILPVANGGTGWASFAAGAIPYGNGSSALATTSAGTAGQVLAFLNGVPTWTATTTFSAPLSYVNGAVSLAQADGSTSGYLAAADWTLFNNKVASTSLSAAFPLAYNSATGVFSTAFSTTTNNTWSGLNAFANSSSTLATLGNAWITGVTASRLLALDENGKLSATTTIGWNLLKGPASSIFAFDASGNPTATTTIGTNYITGTLGTINNTAFSRGDSITISAASSSLLTDNNTFSGSNIFSQPLSLSSTSGTTTIASGQGFTIGASQFVLQQGSGNVGIGTTSPQYPLTVVGKLSLNEGTLRGFTLSTRDALAGSLPVPSFRPTDANTTLALDLMPNGSPAEFGTNGYAWLDVCDTDILVGNPAVTCGRIGARSGAIEMGSRSFNGASAKPLWLTVDGTNALTIATSTNVGIATTTPQYPLSVDGDVLVGDFIRFKANPTVNLFGIFPATGQMEINQDVTSAENNWFFHRFGGASNKVYLGDDGTNSWIAGGHKLYLKANMGSTPLTSATPDVTIDSGNVGIGTTTPTAQLSTTGAVRFAGLGSGGANLVTDALGNVTASSDERLKDKQGDFTRGLTAINAISPVLYKWRPETGFDTQATYAGFFAQNVQAAIPEAVSPDSRGYLTLADRPILAALVNATKEIAAITGAFKDSLIAWLGDATNGIGRIRAHELCADDICVTRDELAALLASATVAKSNDSRAASASALQAPVIELNGNASSTIEVDSTYNDLGARIVAPESDLNLGLTIILDGATTTQVSIDTSVPGTHAILYTVTSPTTGLTGSIMRTVTVSPTDLGMPASQQTESEPPSDEPQPANDNPFNAPAPANDNAAPATTTPAIPNAA